MQKAGNAPQDSVGYVQDQAIPGFAKLDRLDGCADTVGCARPSRTPGKKHPGIPTVALALGIGCAGLIGNVQKIKIWGAKLVSDKINRLRRNT